MKCSNSVIQVVPTRYDYKEVKMKCGDTSIHGEPLLCDHCLDKNERPWWLCKHGRDLSENEMACPNCNAENE
jgi:hypothetical protein